jgi:hypothetical protein
MKNAGWSYELPPTGAASEGVQDYEVQSADEKHLGVAVDVVRRDDSTFLLLDAGRMPPLSHRRIAVRWQDVTDIDHELLVVSLSLSRADLDEHALALDAGKAVHGPGAQAVRATGFDTAIVSGLGREAERPVIEPGYALLPIVLVVGAIYSVFVTITVWIFRGVGPWQYALLALPLVLTVLAIALEGYRFYRAPHVRRGPRGHPSVAPP